MRGRFSRFFAGASLIEHYSGSEMLQERFYDCKISLSLSLSIPVPSPFTPRLSCSTSRRQRQKLEIYIYIYISAESLHRNRADFLRSIVARLPLVNTLRVYSRTRAIGLGICR